MRTVEVFDIDLKQWEEIDFKKLKDGDLFRLFDSGARYVDETNGKHSWIAKGFPYKNKKGIWTVNAI